MYSSEKAAEKMLSLKSDILRYKVLYMKKRRIVNDKHTLSERQIKIILTLLFYEKNTISDIAGFMGINKSTLSIIVAKMQKKGLIEKKLPDSDDDKRKLYLILTEKGHEQFKSLCDIAVQSFVEVYDSLSEEKKNITKESIDSLFVSSNYKNWDFYKYAQNRNKYKYLGQNDEVTELAFKFYIFFIYFNEYYEEILRKGDVVSHLPDDLTKNRFNILFCISFFKLNTVSSLERYLNLSGSTVSISVSKLVKDGYVEKLHSQNDNDGRIVYLSVTQKGSKAIEVIKKDILDVLKSYFDGFTYNERKIIINAFEKLAGTLDTSEGLTN